MTVAGVVELLLECVVSVADGVYEAEMFATPGFAEANMTWQLALAPVCEPRLHGLPWNNVPVAIPVSVKATVPDGAVAPVVEMSVTVAVQYEAKSTDTLVGVHESVVVVVRGLTTMLVVPWLPP